MIDTTGIITIGSLNGDPESNGLFLFKDGSIGFGYKLKGFTFSSYTQEEAIFVYTKLKNIINQLEEFYKGEGGVYQFISQKNYSIKEKFKEFKKYNFILNDTLYKKKPYFLKQVIDYNFDEYQKIIENLGLFEYDNYIFVRFFVNFKKLGLNVLEILKNVFLNLRDDRIIKETNEYMENIIHIHNSRFREIDARPLTLLEMVNVFRKFLGFSELKEFPNMNNDDSYLRVLFPGKITIENDYIKTEEKVFVEDKTKYALEKKNEETLEKINNLNKRDFTIIKNGPEIERKKMDSDLYLLLTESLGRKPSEISSMNLEEKYILFKENITEILERTKDYIYEGLKFFTKYDLIFYKLEKSYEYRNIINSETYLKIFSAQELPQYLKIGSGANFHSLPGDYSIVLNFKKMNKKTTQLKMRRQITVESVKISIPILKWMLPIEAIEAKIQLLKQMMQELERLDFSRVETSMYLVLRSNNLYDKRESIIYGDFANQTNIKWMKEKDNASFHILNCALPTVPNNFSLNLSKRTFILNTTNIAQLAPFPTEEKGAKKPIMTFVTRGGGLLNVNLNEAPAGHFMIAGSTGGGKSVLGNKIAFNSKITGKTVVVTEKGNSFERTALFFGGKVYKPDMSGNIKINPFVISPDAFSNRPDAEEIKIDEYIKMTAAMAEMCNNFNENMKQMYYELIVNTFERNGRLNRKYVKNYAVTPTQFLKIMQVDERFRKFQDEINSFKRFTDKGPWGRIFDGNEGLDLNSPFIQIDTNKISDSGLKDFVFKSLLSNVYFTLSTTKRKFININDEFWDIISAAEKNKNAIETSMEQIESFYRVARKLGGDIGAISQAINDIEKSQISGAVFVNTSHIFLTSIKAEDRESAKKLFTLQSEHLDVLNNLALVSGIYSEYFVIAPYGERLPGQHINRNLRSVFAYYPTPLEYALFTTDPDERIIFEILYEILGADPKYPTMQAVNKAILFFLWFFPNGIKNNQKFQEKLFLHQMDLKNALKDFVFSETGKNIREFLNTLSWN